jgi:hypothetical protein
MARVHDFTGLDRLAFAMPAILTPPAGTVKHHWRPEKGSSGCNGQPRKGFPPSAARHISFSQKRVSPGRD